MLSYYLALREVPCIISGIQGIRAILTNRTETRVI